MKTPAFQFYPGDFLSSPDVQLMTTQEIGAYCLLLFYAWIITESPGHLPNDDDKLQRLSKLNKKEWDKVKGVVLEKFPVTDCGKFRYNARMLKEHSKQETRRQRLAENGKKGGRPPKSEDKQEEVKQEPTENLQVNSGKPNPKQEKRLSSSSSSSSSTVVIPPNPQGGTGEGSEMEVEKQSQADRDMAMFENFRLAYPGTKRGLDTEYAYFRQKHKDTYRQILPTLSAKLEIQIAARRALQEANARFIPEWKHLKTYIFNKGWEEETSPAAIPEAQEPTYKQQFAAYGL